MDRDRYARAISNLRTALGIDAEFAEAMSLLGQALGHSGFQGWLPQSTAFAEILELTRYAVRCGSGNPHVLASAAYAEAVFGGSYNRSDQYAADAIAAAPNSAYVRINCGIAFSYGGRSQDAIDCLRFAQRLSPRDVQAHRLMIGLVIAMCFSKQFEDAERIAREILRDNPGHVSALRYLAVSLAHLGRIDEAKHVVGEICERAPASSLELARKTNFRNRWQLDLYIGGLEAAGMRETALP